jgi:cytidine deaminase
MAAHLAAPTASRLMGGVRVVVVGCVVQWNSGSARDVGRHEVVVGSARSLDDAEIALVELARRTIDAVTDAGPDEDGVHTMGAAVRSADGRMFAGVNLYHFTGGPCAELVALASARAAGAFEITHVVAVGNHGRGVCSPCGRDRQVFVDYYPGLRVVVPTADGLRSVLASDLLPGAWVAPPGQ